MEGAVSVEFRRPGRMSMFVPAARGFDIRPLVRFCSYEGVPYRERFDLMYSEEIAAELDRDEEGLDEHPTLVALEGHLTRGVRPLMGMFERFGTKTGKQLFVCRIDPVSPPRNRRAEKVPLASWRNEAGEPHLVGEMRVSPDAERRSVGSKERGSVLRMAAPSGSDRHALSVPAETPDEPEDFGATPSVGPTALSSVGSRRPQEDRHLTVEILHFALD
jgi:hypothetical protein